MTDKKLVRFWYNNDKCGFYTPEQFNAYRGEPYETIISYHIEFKGQAALSDFKAEYIETLLTHNNDDKLVKYSDNCLFIRAYKYCTDEEIAEIMLSV